MLLLHGGGKEWGPRLVSNFFVIFNFVTPVGFGWVGFDGASGGSKRARFMEVLGGECRWEVLGIRSVHCVLSRAAV